MKKLLLLLSFFTSIAATNAQLVISEILYDAPNTGTDSIEYVEIHNAGLTTVNVKNYYFKNAFIDTLPDVNIPSGARYMVVSNAAYFKAKFGFEAHQWKSGGLNNTGENIELWSNTGAIVDSVRYSAAAPWPVVGPNGARSIVLCDSTANNYVGANWSACAIASKVKIAGVLLFATPGAANCGAATNNVVANNDNVSTTVNKSIKITALRNDVFTNPVTITATSKGPFNGTITINKDTIVYTPKKDYCGADEFTYTISDGTLTSSAIVVIQITGCQTAGSIKDAKATNTAGVLTQLNNIFELSGVVNAINFRAAGLEFPIIDAAGDAIGIFSSAKSFGYAVKEGDKVTVKGKLTQFNGYAQITADTIYKTGTGAVATPKVVTKLDESTESQIVTLKGVTLVNANAWVAAGSGFNVEVTDGTNKTVVRIDKETDLFSATAPTGKFDITGVGYQFDNASPFTEGYQLYPRYKQDIKLIVATNDLALGVNIQTMPNPFNEELRINTSESMDYLTVTDAVGRIVFATNNVVATMSINTTDWKSGIYFATFVKNNRQFTTKLIK